MDDPYWRYAAPGRDPRAAFPGYLPSDSSTLASHTLLGSNDLRGTSSDYLQRDVLTLRSGTYGLDDIGVIGNHATPAVGGITAGASIRGFTPLEDPALIRQEAALGIKSGMPDIERSNALRRSESLATEESNILFVDGLPSDCTRREVAHLFRPFIGFKEIRVVHKEPRRSGDRARVLCFVEFNDAKCAMTALEALQAYKFDEKKPDAPILRIQFAQFPFRPPGHEEQGHGSAR